MTVILDGILSEIASVALLSRNDKWYKRKKPLGILDSLWCHPPIKSGDDKKRKLGDFYRDCPVKLRDDIVGNFR